MPTYYQNPESSLKRANEFCEVGKLDEALECLSDALKNRKNRMMKQHIHESIINKFLELCIELKKSQTAKDGLYSYRNLCQGVNMKSWEDAICKYVQLAESRVENAQELFQSIILDIDDLDQDVTPEGLLKYVSSEGSQERTERIMLLPSIKLLWECYRNCLDLLRYTLTSKLYHTVAQSAFKFCVRYSRRTEIRKLCNLLRVHSAHIQKRQAVLKSDDTETQQLFLETGFVELESAINMELWQDAFKTIEVIHSVIAVSKRSQHSRIMSHYFDKLSGVFWKGEEFLYHAAAVFRHFLLCRDQKKNLNSDEIAKLACRVMLSVMSVPFASNYPANDLVAETDLSIIDKKNRSLSNLLDLTKHPTRSTLVKDVIRLNIIQYVPKEFEDLFYGIEHDVNPFQINFLFTSVVSCIGAWNGCNLEQYIPLLQKVTIVRLLSILPNIYTSVTISKLLNLSGLSCITSLEVILVDSARKYGFPIKMDHRNQCVHFSSDFDIFKNEKVLVENEPDYAFSDTSLKCLTHIHSALTKLVKEISPDHIKKKNKKTAEEIKIHFEKEWENYRKRLLLRKNIIEEHKENMENIRLRKEEEEKKRLAAKLLEHETAEKNRLIKETEERNLLRLRREQKDMKRKILLEKVETFKKSAIGTQIVDNFNLDNLDDLDPENLFSKQIEQINKEKKELNAKLQRQERNFDHVERAKRIEEILFLEVQHKEDKEADMKIWLKNEQNKVEHAYKDREEDLLKKSKMLFMKDDMENFLELLKKKRQSTFSEEMKQFNHTLEEEKVIKLKSRAASRKIERKKEWLTQQTLLLKMKQIESSKSRSSADTEKVKMKKEQEVNEKIVNEKDLVVHFSLYPMACFRFAKKEIFTDSTSKNDSEIKSDSSEQTKFPSYEISPKFPRKPYYEDSKQNKQKTQTQEKQRTERFEHSATFYSEFSNRSNKSRNESYRSSYCSASSYRESNEDEFSWRLPALRNITKQNDDIDSAYSHKFRQFNSKDKDSTLSKKWGPFSSDNVPRGAITIMRRKDDGLENRIPDKQIMKDPAPEVLPNEKPSDNRTDAYHSCTPWAKLKRQEFDK